MISKTIGYNGVHYFQTHPDMTRYFRRFWRFPGRSTLTEVKFVVFTSSGSWCIVYPRCIGLVKCWTVHKHLWPTIQSGPRRVFFAFSCRKWNSKLCGRCPGAGSSSWMISWSCLGHCIVYLGHGKGCAPFCRVSLMMTWAWKSMLNTPASQRYAIWCKYNIHF